MNTTDVAIVSAGSMKQKLQSAIASITKRPIIAIALSASFLACIYWVIVASDQYVSESHFIVQRTDMPSGQSADLSSLIGGMGNGNRADQLLLRDHLLSVDMLKALEQKLHLREHYSDWHRDPISRMWFKDAPIERFYQHFLSRVSVELDDYTGVLVIKAQAYDAKMAYAITQAMVQESESFMNAMAHNLAMAQVTFLEQQVGHIKQRALDARQAVIDYQNRKGLVSPQATAENISAIVGKLQAKLTELETERVAMQAYLVPTHANIVLLSQQIDAIRHQIEQENSKLAAPEGAALNKTVEEFQRLQMEAKFADDIFKTALVALEKGRVDATRTIKKVSQLQSPTIPEYAMEPRRLYNSVVFFVIAMLLAGVAHLIVSIVRDHAE